jgi:hypothetical protein
MRKEQAYPSNQPAPNCLHIYLQQLVYIKFKSYLFFELKRIGLLFISPSLEKDCVYSVLL